MGYPMTYQRVIHRNRLHEGGYDAERVGPFTVAEQSIADMTDEARAALFRHMAETQHERIVSMVRARNLILGDLRRLEVDSIDEGATVAYIANRTEADPEIVTAILREFLRW